MLGGEGVAEELMAEREKSITLLDKVDCECFENSSRLYVMMNASGGMLRGDCVVEELMVKREKGITVIPP
ncbi:hypothetical protein V6N13_064324 [Hibiscus sabdariffa]